MNVDGAHCEYHNRISDLKHRVAMDLVRQNRATLRVSFMFDFAEACDESQESCATAILLELVEGAIG